MKQTITAVALVAVAQASKLHVEQGLKVKSDFDSISFNFGDYGVAK